MSKGEGSHRPYIHNGHLSPCEEKILRHCCRGDDNATIAHTVGISEQTVKNYMSSIYYKWKVKNRIQAFLEAVKRGYVIPLSIDRESVAKTMYFHMEEAKKLGKVLEEIEQRATEEYLEVNNGKGI